MFALTGDDLAAMLQGLNQQTLIGLGGIAALWATKFIPKGMLAGLWTKAKSLVKPKESTPDDEDESYLPLHDLVKQLRVLTCDEPPLVRDGIAKHLDGIEALISGAPNER